jgi:hypothetical protein
VSTNSTETSHISALRALVCLQLACTAGVPHVTVFAALILEAWPTIGVAGTWQAYRSLTDPDHCVLSACHCRGPLMRQLLR